ncbi:MAG: type VI secretion system baseplate subunit TssG [Acidobacteriota bacterium]|nr:type VI secretion system baseplate subunit TssG [Acidobacteriota bacterium]
MAAEGGRSVPTLEDELFEEAYRFEFFQAVRLLERLNPTRAAVGLHHAAPSEEIVRFRTRPSLQFPASEVHELNRNGDDEAPPEMTVNFIGLTGPSGVLPAHTTELVAERARHRDSALWEFFDLFGHRMASLFYRAWDRYRFTVTFERGERDEFREHLFSLIGMGTRGLRGRLGLPDEGLLLYAGLVAQRPHSASAIESILGDYFQVPARVESFTGQWLELDAESLCRLGRANSELGYGTIAGSRVWDAQSKFRVRFGPLALKEFTALLPTGRNYQPAVRLAGFVASAELDFDFQLVLNADEVPECRLGAESPARPMLGWTTWLKTRPFAHDDSQVVLAAHH